jgi:hypothetical protein
MVDHTIVPPRSMIQAGVLRTRPRARFSRIAITRAAESARSPSWQSERAARETSQPKAGVRRDGVDAARTLLSCTNPGHLFGAGPVAAFRREELSDVGARDGCLSGKPAVPAAAAPAAPFTRKHERAGCADRPESTRHGVGGERAGAGLSIVKAAVRGPATGTRLSPIARLSRPRDQAPKCLCNQARLRAAVGRDTAP